MTEKEAECKVTPQSTALTVEEAITVGNMMAKSGYFDDARQAAQAVVKILAGREMGFGPFAAMTGISIIKGKPVITANLMAAAVRAHPRYGYKIISLSDDVCELAFYRDGNEVGHSTFTAKDAQAAEVGKLVAPGAAGNMMKRFPRNMLFARAMSNGVKWYCPDVFMGAAVYTPGELPSDGGTVVDGECTEVTGIAADQTHDLSEPDADAAPHWIDDPKTKAGCFAWLKEKSLSHEDALRLLKIKGIHEFAGTREEFKVAVMAAIHDETEAAKTKPEPATKLQGDIAQYETDITGAEVDA